MSNIHTAFTNRGYSSKMILLLYIFNQKSPEKHIKSKQDKKITIYTIKTPICHVSLPFAPFSTTDVAKAIPFKHFHTTLN
jgi:hypothetical protein